MERHRDGDAGSGKRPAALVVSDVLIYREGIAAGLARIGDLEVVGAISAEELVRRACRGGRGDRVRRYFARTLARGRARRAGLVAPRCW